MAGTGAGTGFCVIKTDILRGSVRFGNHPDIIAATATAAHVYPVKLAVDFCVEIVATP